jgi:hypothetical protein
MGTWALAMDRSQDLGLFQLDLRRLAIDVFGMPAETTTVKGKTYIRAPRSGDKRIRDDLAFLSQTMLCGFGEKTFDPAQPLIQKYEFQDNVTGEKSNNWYLHAPFAWAEARYNFVQLPTAALRLDAHHSDLVLGVANVLRNHAHHWLKTGSLTLTLEAIAREAGQPVDPMLRNKGASYWPRLRERITNVVREGGFGQVSFGPGDRGQVEVTIEPVEHLVIVYSSLLPTAERRQAATELAKREAEVRRQLLPAPKAKRPSKRP